MNAFNYKLNIMVHQFAPRLLSKFDLGEANRRSVRRRLARPLSKCQVQVTRPGQMAQRGRELSQHSRWRQCTGTRTGELARYLDNSVAHYGWKLARGIFIRSWKDRATINMREPNLYIECIPVRLILIRGSPRNQELLWMYVLGKAKEKYLLNLKERAHRNN